MSIGYKKGNLFTSRDSLAHCVSADFKMGAGIARQFASRFGRDWIPTTGRIGQAIHRHDPKHSRYIYYLITKEKFYHKPTYESLKLAIIDMKKHAVIHDVRYLSIPRMGCGLDKLKWSKVEAILERVFRHTNIEITVYTLVSDTRFS